MRTALSAVVAACLAAPVAVAPFQVAQAAQPSSADTERAKTLYREGEKAYRVGKFAEAVAKFEEAYQLSGLPTILYNIGLGYTRLYDVTGDIGDLRQAKAVLQNFYIEVQKDPELEDAEVVEAQLKELDDKLAIAEEEERKRKEEERKRQEEARKNQQQEGPAAPSGADPGKTLRLGGIGGMAGGGAFFATGAVLFSFYLIKGQQFSEELVNIRDDQKASNCDDDPGTMECVELDNREQTTINNGRLSNNLSIFVGGTFAVIGIAGVVTGAILYTRGDKKTKAWKRGEVVLLPTPGGLSLSGRF